MATTTPTEASRSTFAKRPKPSQRMRMAYLLTLVGGYLDAYTYFIRGGVFANAQTGNIIKLSIALANEESGLYLRYIVPICAFTLGLMVALGIKELFERRQIPLIRRTVLALEIVGLTVVGFIPLGDEWNIAANSIVSFVAALQYETFTSFRGEAIVTTMGTGNLRKFVDSLFLGWIHQDMEKFLRAGLFLTIIFAFTGGAVLGARACDALGRAAVIPVILALAVAIVMITALRTEGKRS